MAVTCSQRCSARAAALPAAAWGEGARCARPGTAEKPQWADSASELLRCSLGSIFSRWPSSPALYLHFSPPSARHGAAGPPPRPRRQKHRPGAARPRGPEPGELSWAERGASGAAGGRRGASRGTGRPRRERRSVAGCAVRWAGAALLGSGFSSEGAPECRRWHPRAGASTSGFKSFFYYNYFRLTGARRNVRCGGEPGRAASTGPGWRAAAPRSLPPRSRVAERPQYAVCSPVAAQVGPEEKPSRLWEGARCCSAPVCAARGEESAWEGRWAYTWYRWSEAAVLMFMEGKDKNQKEPKNQRQRLFLPHLFQVPEWSRKLSVPFSLGLRVSLLQAQLWHLTPGWGLCWGVLLYLFSQGKVWWAVQLC